MEKKLATKRQTWALFCATKIDYRVTNPDLTYDEASKLIEEANARKGYVSKKVEKVEKVNDAVRIHSEAVQAGMDALTACVPTPMVVQQHSNMVDDNSPVVKEYFVEGGVCGFCSITFKANTTPNRKFLAGLKKAGLAGERSQWAKNSVGYSFWVSEGGQSLQRKEAYGHAFTRVLIDNGITAYCRSNMD